MQNHYVDKIIKKIIIEKLLNEAPQLSPVTTSSKFSAFIKKIFGDRITLNSTQDVKYKEFLKDIISNYEQQRLNAYVGDIIQIRIKDYIEKHNGKQPSQTEIEDIKNSIKIDFDGDESQNINNIIQNLSGDIQNKKNTLNKKNLDTQEYSELILEKLIPITIKRFNSELANISIAIDSKEINDYKKSNFITLDLSKLNGKNIIEIQNFNEYPLEYLQLAKELYVILNNITTNNQYKNFNFRYLNNEDITSGIVIEIDKNNQEQNKQITNTDKITAKGEKFTNKKFFERSNSISNFKFQQDIFTGFITFKKPNAIPTTTNVNTFQLLFLDTDKKFLKYFPQFTPQLQNTYKKITTDEYKRFIKQQTNNNIPNLSTSTIFSSVKNEDKYIKTDIYTIQTSDKIKGSINLSTSFNYGTNEIKNKISLQNFIQNLHNNGMLKKILIRMLNISKAAEGIEDFFKNDNYDLMLEKSYEALIYGKKNKVNFEKKLEYYFGFDKQNFIDNYLNMFGIDSDVKFKFDSIKATYNNKKSTFEEFLVTEQNKIRKIKNFRSNSTSSSTNQQKNLYDNYIDSNGDIEIKGIISLILIKLFCNANQFILETLHIILKYIIDIAKKYDQFEFSPYAKENEKISDIDIDTTNNDPDKIIEYFNNNLFNNVIGFKNTGDIENISLNDIEQTLGLNEQEIILDNNKYYFGFYRVLAIKIIKLLFDRKDYGVGGGEHLAILYFLGIDVGKLILKYLHDDYQNDFKNFVSNISRDTALDETKLQNILPKIVSIYQKFSGGFQHGDINFKQTLPSKIINENLIKNKIFELKEIKSIGTEMRLGAEGIRALHSRSPIIMKVSKIIYDIVNEDNNYNNTNLNLMLKSLIINEINRSISDTNEKLIYIQLLQNYFVGKKESEYQTLISSEGVSNYHSLESGSHRIDKIIEICKLKYVIENILKNLIKDYSSGISKDTNLFSGVENITSNNIGLGSIGVDKKININSKNNTDTVEFDLPIEIKKNNDTLIELDIDDISSLIEQHNSTSINKNNRIKSIQKLFKFDNNTHTIHSELLDLIIMYYNKLNKINIDSLLNDAKAKNYVSAKKCFHGIDFLVIVNNNDENNYFRIIPYDRLDDYLEFTGTSQLRPQFKLKS